jgi:NAD(P)-dependent dehydrogenase (short-subunit alcohol dehydrogenase family)/acyl carrier protein
VGLLDPGKVADTVFEILSYETGYPVDSLHLDMNLENDLGLDSIKKVELLASLSDRFPQAQSDWLSESETLRALVEVLVRAGPSGESDFSLLVEAPSEAAQDLSKVPSQLQAEGQASALGQKAPGPEALVVFDLGKVLEVVSMETGYPVESLSANMDLESDLGLDSIKKVEILALLSEGLEGQTDQDILAQAKTLGDWQNYFSQLQSLKSPGAGNGREHGRGHRRQRGRGHDRDHGRDFDSEKAKQAQAGLGQSAFDQEQIEAAWEAQERSLKVGPPSRSQAPHGPEGLSPAEPRSGERPLSGKEILDRVLASGSMEMPSLWQVEPTLFEAASVEGDKFISYGFVRLVGSDPLAKALEKALSEQGLEVERQPWNYDFDRWGSDVRKARALFLVWPGPDRDPKLITQALSALENMADRADTIVGLSFLGGFFGFPRPDGQKVVLGNSISGALVGLLKCAAREWPQVKVRVLDLPLVLYNSPTPTWVTSILEAAFCQGPVELGLPKRDKVYNLALKPYLPTFSSEAPLGPGDTVVVTGGGRGVTAATMLALAKLYKPTLVILGRTPLPPPEPQWLAEFKSQKEIMGALFDRANSASKPRELEHRANLILSSRELTNNLKALSEAGARVEYLSGDFTSPELIEETARKIRSRFGPIKGFIHGAGILADHPIIGKNQSDFAKVYATKTILASHLLEAFQPEPLRFMVFFSSTTARFGRQGQGDYAAGNEVLNKTAWEMATLHPNCRVLAVNWGPWAGGMVNDSLAGQFKSQGLGLIGLKEGAETFLKLLRTPVGGPAEVVVLGQGTSLDLLSE